MLDVVALAAEREAKPEPHHVNGVHVYAVTTGGAKTNEGAAQPLEMLRAETQLGVVLVALAAEQPQALMIRG